MNKFIKSSIFAAFLFLALNSSVNASEGIFELRNQLGDAARCHATSGIMENQQFQILTLCRDILYPGGTEVFQYVAWATPTDGGDPIRLGTLGLGKQLFKTKEPFNSMFVTKELDDRPKSPGNVVVMRGNLQSIEFLSQRGTVVENPTDNELIDETPAEEPTPTPDVEEVVEGSSRNVFRIIALGGMLTFLAIFGVVLIIFVVSRR